MFLSERYLSILRTDQALLFLKFRTLNNNLPVQKERFVNTSRAERVCTKCNMGEVGDEYHYIFICNFFLKIRGNSCCLHITGENLMY